MHEKKGERLSRGDIKSTTNKFFYAPELPATPYEMSLVIDI